MHIPVRDLYRVNIAFLWFGVLRAITESDLILSQIKFPETEEVFNARFQIITRNWSGEKQDDASGKRQRHTCYAAENEDVDRPLPVCPLITSASRASCCVLLAQWRLPGLIANMFIRIAQCRAKETFYYYAACIRANLLANLFLESMNSCMKLIRD